MFLIIKFPIAAVTNHHKLGDLKTLKFILYSFGSKKFELVSLGENQSIYRTVLLSETLGENSFSCLSQLLEPHSLPF